MENGMKITITANDTTRTARDLNNATQMYGVYQIVLDGEGELDLVLATSALMSRDAADVLCAQWRIADPQAHYAVHGVS